MEIDSHERLTEDAEAKMLQEVVEAPYRKAGEETSLQSSVSKQTVKNKIHKLEFPKYNVERDKKVVDYLYIDADEDHVHLQFRETKGDLELDGNNRKNNCVLSKIVYWKQRNISCQTGWLQKSAFVTGIPLSEAVRNAM